MTEIITSDREDGKGTALNRIGYRAFENCTSLQSLTLPASYNGADQNGNGVFHLSTVMGCTSLKNIKTFSNTIQFVTDAESENDGIGGYDGGSKKVDGDYTFDRFKADVKDTFWIEGPGYKVGSSGEKSQTHNVANLRHICFKYLDEDRYEIMEKGFSSTATSDEDVGLIYQVKDRKSVV